MPIFSMLAMNQKKYVGHILHCSAVSQALHCLKFLPSLKPFVSLLALLFIHFYDVGSVFRHRNSFMADVLSYTLYYDETGNTASSGP